MGMGIRVIGGAGDDALSVDSGSLLVKPYRPGSPYTQWYIVSATSTAFENGYWVSTTGCRGFKASLAASATWTASAGWIAVVFSTDSSASLTAVLDEAEAAYGTPAHTALPNTLYINSIGVNDVMPAPVEVWVTGSTRIKTIGMKAYAAHRVKLETWI